MTTKFESVIQACHIGISTHLSDDESWSEPNGGTLWGGFFTGPPSGIYTYWTDKENSFDLHGAFVYHDPQRRFMINITGVLDEDASNEDLDDFDMDQTYFRFCLYVHHEHLDDFDEGPLPAAIMDAVGDFEELKSSFDSFSLEDHKALLELVGGVVKPVLEYEDDE